MRPQMECITYELKYCERCGALGLRRSQSPESYCESCGKILINYSSAGEGAGRSSARTVANRIAGLLKVEAQTGSNLLAGRLQ